MYIPIHNEAVIEMQCLQNFHYDGHQGLLSMYQVSSSTCQLHAHTYSIIVYWPMLFLLVSAVVSEIHKWIQTKLHIIDPFYITELPFDHIKLLVHHKLKAIIEFP